MTFLAIPSAPFFALPLAPSAAAFNLSPIPTLSATALALSATALAFFAALATLAGTTILAAHFMIPATNLEPTFSIPLHILAGIWKECIWQIAKETRIIVAIVFILIFYPH